MIAWQEVSFSVDHHRINRYSVSILLRSKDDSPWWLTRVYGPQHDVDKIPFLEDLREVRAWYPSPWMVAGDSNMIYCSEDESNINQAMMGQF